MALTDTLLLTSNLTKSNSQIKNLYFLTVPGNNRLWTEKLYNRIITSDIFPGLSRDFPTLYIAPDSSFRSLILQPPKTYSISGFYNCDNCNFKEKLMQEAIKSDAILYHEGNTLVNDISSFIQQQYANEIIPIFYE